MIAIVKYMKNMMIVTECCDEAPVAEAIIQEADKTIQLTTSKPLAMDSIWDEDKENQNKLW